MVWSLEELAHTADMSRARFAVAFREMVVTTPLDYLTDWRVSVAQTLLKSGKSLKLVAPAVGYSHPSHRLDARVHQAHRASTPSIVAKH